MKTSYNMYVRCASIGTVIIQQRSRRIVSQQEVEEVLRGRHLKTAQEIRRGEERYTAIGKTRQGRALKIIITKRKSKIRVISAWESRQVRRLLDDEHQEVTH